MFHILTQIYTANHATFPIQKYAITVYICGEDQVLAKKQDPGMILDSEKQPGKIRTGIGALELPGDVWRQKYENKKEG